MTEPGEAHELSPRKLAYYMRVDTRTKLMERDKDKAKKFKLRVVSTKVTSEA